MRDTYLVRIDLERLCTRLAGADGSPAQPRAARHWLTDLGFIRAGKSDEWVVEDLSPLEEDEIVSFQLNNEFHGSVD